MSTSNLKESQVRLDNSYIDMTMNIYTHVIGKVKLQTVEKLAKCANFERIVINFVTNKLVLKNKKAQTLSY